MEFAQGAQSEMTSALQCNPLIWKKMNANVYILISDSTRASAVDAQVNQTGANRERKLQYITSFESHEDAERWVHDFISNCVELSEVLREAVPGYRDCGFSGGESTAGFLRSADGARSEEKRKSALSSEDNGYRVRLIRKEHFHGLETPLKPFLNIGNCFFRLW